MRVVNVGPQRGDAPDALGAEWLALRPGTDVALMLGLAHTLEVEGLVDRRFLERNTVGYDRFRAYLLGETDGVARDAAWAAGITGTDPGIIEGLAREMAARRTLLSASWSLQRAQHGEQPYWMLVVLAAMVGDIGLEGCGVGFGYSAEGFVGSGWRPFAWRTLPKGRNPTGAVIPVARIADMLLSPGGTVRYDGREIEYPDVRLVYWAGGNPFHHHQDLNRLLEAWRKPETIIVNEPWWTPIARHADIVFPATVPLERDDLCASSHDPYAHAMRRALEPHAESRSDHQILRGLAERLGFVAEFTEGRSEGQWLRWMWDRSRELAAAEGIELPSFDDFWEAGQVRLPDPPAEIWLGDFRRDPERHPLSTPSGKIEIFSERIDSFGASDCPGHPRWLEPAEWLGGERARELPLHLLSNQPRTRLHSQLDQSRFSQSHKIAGREALRLHPGDAAERGIEDGDTVRVFNRRGQCLAGARLSDDLMPGVVELPTGAWFDPLHLDAGAEHPTLELAGNPNVLTEDRGTSELAQGPAAHTCLVEVEKWNGEAPAPGVYAPPLLERGGG